MIDVFVAAEDSQRERALALVTQLRHAGLSVDLDLAGRAMKGQMKQADRLGARRTVVIDEAGDAQVREMDTGAQRPLDLAIAVEVLSE